MKKILVISVTAFSFFGVCSTLLFTSCQKKSVTPNVPVSQISEPSILPPGVGQGSIGCWYFGTPTAFGCTLPSSPFCDVKPKGPFDNFADPHIMYGNFAYHPTGFQAEINVTTLDPAVITQWISSQALEVPVSREIPYELVTAAYNAAGITQDIPQFFMPQGNWNIQLHETGNPEKMMRVQFIDANTIQLHLDI
jgi:hypothetical protein